MTEVRDIVDLDLSLDPQTGVWRDVNVPSIGYSDGRHVETYLKKVFRACSDVSSLSRDLEGRIKDWPSEYHLSAKRANLLRGFEFDRSSTVLEIGSGCGAITRFLGETFEQVVAVEGSYERARLARMRTRDQKNVSVVCSPFQNLKFKVKFDIIICIGVLEYSGMFVSAPDPYGHVLDFIHDNLKENGTLVLAIENQLGLKYFASSPEDHTGVMFDGIEGYPCDKGVKTFGYKDLRLKIGKRFDRAEFFLPYPDYKLPQCILSEDMMDRVAVGELVGNVSNRVTDAPRGTHFDERLALLEVERNGLLPHVSNSFLVLASKGAGAPISRDWLGVLFNTSRSRGQRTATYFKPEGPGSVRACKSLLDEPVPVPEATFEHRVADSAWIDAGSVALSIYRNARCPKLSLADIFSPARPWLETLESVAERRSGTLWVDGQYLDALWQNSIVQDGECVFFDLEWVWKDDLPLNAIIIRAIHTFLNEYVKSSGLNNRLLGGSAKKIIREVASSLGIELREEDFAFALAMEAHLSSKIFGGDEAAVRKRISMSMMNPRGYDALTRKVRSARRVLHVINEKYFPDRSV